MEEKVFHVDRAFALQPIKNLLEINNMIQEALENDIPVYFTVPYGTFIGSTVRMIAGGREPRLAAKIFMSVQYRPNINEYAFLKGVADGTDRKFDYSLKKAFPSYGTVHPFDIIIGGDRETNLIRKDKNATTHLVDFLGNEINEGDYVLMRTNPNELQESGSPFRMLRYTGKRSDKQAQFVYIKLETNTAKTPDGGETIRVGLNGVGQAKTNLIYGVKVDVDESLATAMQLTDHDMSIYPIKFHVGIQE